MSPSRCPNCNSPILQNQVICGECGVKLRSMMLNSKSTLSKHAKSGTTRKSIKLVLFAALLVTLNGGILIFIVTWDEYHYSNSFYYNPLNPPLNTVDVDLTSLFYPYNINYNSSPSSPIVKIDLDIKITAKK